MATRPRLLLLAQSLPYPPHSGVASRTFHILEQLQLAFDVELVAFARVRHHPDRRAREAAWHALGEVATSVAEPTPIPNEHSALRKVWDHVRSVISGRAYTHYEYDSAVFADRLERVLRARTPDLVHLDSLDLARWLPHLPRVPVACTHHDIDSELLRGRAQRIGSTLLRHYLWLQANRVERVLRAVCPRLALNVMMSEVDAGRLRALAPAATTVVVPNGTDPEYFRPRGASIAGRVVFVGPTYNHPNRDAVEWLLQEIWPRIRVLDRGTSLELVGGNAPTDRARYAAQPGVTALGYVPDVRPPLTEARCCVVPIRVGGGTRLKILDAWAMGKAVVSTAIGAEGLAVRDGENILIRDTPQAFAEAVLRVLRDDGLRRHLEHNARRTAVAHYSWGVIGRRLRAAYDALLARPAPPQARPAIAVRAIPRLV